MLTPPLLNDASRFTPTADDLSFVRCPHLPSPVCSLVCPDILRPVTGEPVFRQHTFVVSR